MVFREGVGVVLPKQNLPWILDGREQPKVIKKIFVTPDGFFPRMKDITALFGRSRREIEDRRIRHKSPKFKDWYVIECPTMNDILRAFRDVNRYYVQHHNKNDNCRVCNAIDEALFKEKCWLVSTTHNCETVSKDTEEIEITYSYAGEDYTVNLQDWLDGVTPHKEVK